MATLAKTEGNAAQHVSFYFAAHQDDWQLFMNPLRVPRRPGRQH